MTQLLSLFSSVFGNQSKSRDLEQYIIDHIPTASEQVDEITRDYLYHYATSRGF